MEQRTEEPAEHIREYRYVNSREFTALPRVPRYSAYPEANQGGPPGRRSAKRSSSRRRRTESFDIELDALEEDLDGRAHVYERFFSSLGEAGDPEHDDRMLGEDTGFASKLAKLKRKVSAFMHRILVPIRGRRTPEDRMRRLRISWPIERFGVVTNGKFRHHYDHDIEPRLKASAVEPEPSHDVPEERGRSLHRHPGGHQRENRSISVRRDRSVG
ncbi:hypothetical protein Plec18167_003112 [Paecilomyces lecythidis]|uniref:Uncharacterized protein n=1 Tax=Paecilomyces lecythidis TaxID=3004212 RepID=A0ABR3Y0V0_9EURO